MSVTKDPPARTKSMLLPLGVRPPLLLCALALVCGCGEREVGGNPPPDFPQLRELDRTADPACEGTWMAGIRGRVVDARGRGVAGATVQHCLRLADGRFICTSPPTGEDGRPALRMTDTAGWYPYVFEEDVRCVDELAVRVLTIRPDEPPSYGTTYCKVPLMPDDAVQLLPRPAVLYDVSEPTMLPAVGDETMPRDVAFEGGVVLTGLVPSRLFGGDYEDLRGGRLPADARPCFVPDALDDLLGIYAFAPEVDLMEPVGLRLPNDTGLADGTPIALLVLGGLGTVRSDGTVVPEAAFERFGTATVQGDAIVSDEGVAVPSLTMIGWRVIEPAAP